MLQFHETTQTDRLTRLVSANERPFLKFKSNFLGGWGEHGNSSATHCSSPSVAQNGKKIVPEFSCEMLIFKRFNFCPQGLVVAIGAANFALSEVQADFLHRKGYNLMFILCVVIKAIGYLLCAVLVVLSFFNKLCIWA